MENYEELRSHRHEVKARMDELAQTDEVRESIDAWVGNIKCQSQQHLEDRLGFMRDTFADKNGFTARKDLTDECLLVKVVTSSVIRALKNEIRTRQIEARKAKLSQRLYR